jgi:3-methyl-2-oxobutanoate hydroxymethyltransferase
LIKKKRQGKKLVMLTAYDALLASALDAAKTDVILVGDSIGNVFCGEADTLSVTLDQMIYHAQSVSRVVSYALVVGDLPFMSYHINPEQARQSAGRMIKEGRSQAVKMEVSPSLLPAVKAVCEIGIPVMAHIGFTPQSVHQLGGYRVQGRDRADADVLISLALSLEALGCFAIVLEMVPETLAAEITKQLRIPTFGIGAGVNCDGQVLVTQDLLGLTPQSPKFVKRYAQLGTIIQDAVLSFRAEVASGVFPGPEHGF